MTTQNIQNGNELAVMAPQGGGMLTTFKDLEQMFRFSEFLAKSPLLPDAFNGNPGSVMIALNMAQRLRMDPLMVMQNIVIVHGNAGLSGKFAIALLNRSPKYSRIEYRYVNGKDYTGGMQVIGHRKDDPGDKRPDVGTAVTLEMARAEGWTSNKKWQTMPEQMMRYRAAAFFARAFVPEELLGMQTAEELEDVGAGAPMYDVKSSAAAPRGLKLAKPAKKGREQVEQDGAAKPVVAGNGGEKVAAQVAAKPVVAGKEGEKMATEDAPDDGELLLQAGLEEMEGALVWLDKSLRGSGASWSKVYRVCEALGVPHPEPGASREDMAAFALAVRSDAEVRKALEESAIVFEKN